MRLFLDTELIRVLQVLVHNRSQGLPAALPLKYESRELDYPASVAVAGEGESRSETIGHVPWAISSWAFCLVSVNCRR